jgi:hypothetical protein
LVYIIPYSNHVISSRYFILPSVISGIVLYRVRGRQPFLYGSVEICVALLAIFVSIATRSSAPLNKILGILGGIYILVRGMDNVDKGLPLTWRKSWDRWFPKMQPKQPTQPPEAATKDAAESST